MQSATKPHTDLVLLTGANVESLVPAMRVALPLPNGFKGQKLRDLITGKAIASADVVELETYAVMLLAGPVP
jgi:hypothetical protein